MWTLNKMSGDAGLVTAAKQSRRAVVAVIWPYQRDVDEAGQEEVGGPDLPEFSPSGARCCSATVWAVPGFCPPLRHSVFFFFFGLKTFNTTQPHTNFNPHYLPLSLEPHRPSELIDQDCVCTPVQEKESLCCKKWKSVRPSIFPLPSHPPFV